MDGGRVDGGMSGWRDGTYVILMTLTFVHKKWANYLYPNEAFINSCEE